MTVSERESDIVRQTWADNQSERDKMKQREREGEDSDIFCTCTFSRKSQKVE